MDTLDPQERRLRWMGALAALYLCVVGGVTWVWLRWFGVEPSPVVTVVLSLPAILGAVLAMTSTTDERQYVARVLACMMFTPVLLLFWATSLDPHSGAAVRPVWPFATGFVAVHALCFVATIFWGGSALTAVPAARGVAVIGSSELRARLLSLNAVSAPFLVANGSGTVDIVVAYRFSPDVPRSHHVLLKLDAARREVRVRERTGAAGARPINADEASMRSPGDPFFDPTRPNATQVWGKTAQTTQIERERLNAVPLRFQGQDAKLPADFAAAIDGDGMLTVLCAVVTRSGWRWQPVFFGSGDR